MSKLFAELAKKGWLTGKEDKRTKEFVVTSVCRTHAEITGLLSSHENDDGENAFETARDAEARTKETFDREAEKRASMYTGAAFAAFVSEDPAKTPPPLVVEEKFRAPNSARSVFEKLAESDSPSYKERFAFSPDQTYTRAEACAVAEAYCELFLDTTPGSDKRQKGGYITLDTTFCDALFKGVLKKGETYPTRVRRDDALGSLWLDRFHRVSFLRRGARSVIKKGDLPPVRVESERRGGDRKVTRVFGFETYLIDAEELRETLARVLATNCRVEELEATKNRAPGAKAVVAAGNAVEKTSFALLTHYGVPAVHVATKDVFKGKGKNK
jgi:translation initiation factor 2D